MRNIRQRRVADATSAQVEVTQMARKFAVHHGCPLVSHCGDRDGVPSEGWVCSDSQPSERRSGGIAGLAPRQMAMGTLPPLSDQLVFRQVAKIGRFLPPEARSRRNVVRTWPNSFSTRWADSVALMNSR
jgi:hypothetical protein